MGGHCWGGGDWGSGLNLDEEFGWDWLRNSLEFLYYWFSYSFGGAWALEGLRLLHWDFIELFSEQFGGLRPQFF